MGRISHRCSEQCSGVKLVQVFVQHKGSNLTKQHCECLNDSGRGRKDNAKQMCLDSVADLHAGRSKMS